MLESLPQNLRDQLEEKYELLEKLGEGGMGEVYKARHRLLDQIRVIKVMHSRLDEKSSFNQRFKREAQVAADLSHPHIATLHDFAIDDRGAAYIVMEFISGRTLKQILAQDEALSQDFVFAIAQQSLAALGYLHRRGFVHRDVSPDNLMVSLSAGGAPKVTLIDLGIAKGTNDVHDAELTRSGVFLGKIKYASPEHFGRSGSHVKPDPRSDLYSLGLVLYLLFTGHFPIRGDSSAAMIAGHLYQPPVPFEESDPEGRVPKSVRAAISRSLEKEPERRFPDARSFAEALLVGVDVQPLSDSALYVGGGRSDARTQDDLPTVVMRQPGELARKARTFAVIAAAVLGGLVFVSGLTTIESLPFTGWLRSDVHKTGRAGALASLDFGPYYALVIANNLYRELPRLETPIGDGKALAEVLEKRYGFVVEIVEDATREQMVMALERYETIEANSNLLVFYAGHGQIDHFQERVYWQPTDAEVVSRANWLEAQEIVDSINRLPAQRVLVIADSCFSGGFNGADGEDGEDADPEAPAEERDIEEMRTRVELGSRLVLSSGDLNPIADRGRGDHSILVNALLDALTGDDPSTEIFDAHSLFEELEEPVRRVSNAQGTPQEPQFGALEQHGGGSFYFVPRD